MLVGGTPPTDPQKEQGDYPIVDLLKSTMTPSSAEHHQQGRNNKRAKKQKEAAVSRKTATYKADHVLNKNKVRDREGLSFFQPISAY